MSVFQSSDRSFSATLKCVALVALITVNTGCLATHVRWRQPRSISGFRAATAHADSHLSQAECAYAAGLQCERECSDSCVDHYYRAALLSHSAVTTSANELDLSDCRRCQLHQSALNKLVTTGQQFGRLDTASGLTVSDNGQRLTIPISHHGFVWEAQDFEQLVPVGEYSTNAFRDAHRVGGYGVPLVVVGPRQHGRPFLTAEPHFAATLILRVDEPRSDIGDEHSDMQPASCRLELYDPLRVESVCIDDRFVPLAKDLSAPIAYRLRNERRTIVNDFISPQSSDAEGRLFSLEPYQPGKVPVVLVHGLLSDRFTWTDVVNDLQADKGFVDHFQLWLFEYQTGLPFLLSAAELREQTAAAQFMFDPEGTDAAFSQMVLVGHSMGGLISKLQVTSSGDRVWRSVANRPIDSIVLEPDAKERLRRAFFFEPSPQVARVIFIGTPHQGSNDARRLIARSLSALVEEPSNTQAVHRAMIENNPGAFTKELSARVPTSVDLLDPQSALLQSLFALPVSPCVSTHSIIGLKRWQLGLSPSDGVVPVRSAHYPEAESEIIVNSPHTQIHHRYETINEIRRILHELHRTR